ncbi:multicopper oxidase family protein [Nocardioides mesophilus]|uniref:Multicopper oxidase family protein n=2 Tax=Nocardioides mesophilus TaxID=433659 RepID=A0A7G9RHD8_9ACTN|nr:multicopper oxidase family protein [Nocardioides mesophilus]
MEMGYLDHGGGPRTVAGGEGPSGHGMDDMDGHGDGHGDTAGEPGDAAGEPGAATAPGRLRSVAGLVADPDRAADVTVELVARRQQVRLASGRTIEGYTLNGSTPGPLMEVRQGQLLEVHLRNENVGDGVTLHWHGVDVPNAEDGVAGVTQDAVPAGAEHTYRFVADQAGTYWYHSHQVSHEQVLRGLLGPLVVHPRSRRDPAGTTDVVALAHLYSGTATLNGREGDVPVAAAAGGTVRVRLINTDNGPLRAWAAAPYRVLALDGTDVHGPTPVRDEAVTVTAGGRVDLEVTVPDDGSAVRLQVGGDTALVIGPAGTTAPAAPEPDRELDLLDYGSPAPLGFDPDRADRDFRYEIGRRPGFLDGRPGLWWTVNGHVYPDMPMFVVHEGDVVRVRIENHSGDVHPMHLHGHHAVVLSRDGRRATGSPWWFDSLNVNDGESFEVAFVADNPGVWMDHCHNLQHATEGLVTHLMYDDVTTPFRVGDEAENAPE